MIRLKDVVCFVAFAVLANVVGVIAIAAPPNPETSKQAVADLQSTLKGESVNWNTLTEERFASVPLTKADADHARTALWDAYSAMIRATRKEEIDKRILVEGDLKMPFAYRTFGDKPKGGRSLWISLHGGGGAPAQVNDQQWENQKRLYQLEEGIYLAPRAPTNTWNLWHEGHIDRLFARLIEDLIVLEEVNPDRVYVMGYSAGGDGVYQIGPRLADRWAGAAMMAGHPNDASPLSLRNVAFALQVGGKDGAYNRNGVAREWGKTLENLQKEDAKGYPLFFKMHEEKGHWMDREDAAALPWMAKHTRNPIPDRVVWKQTGVAHDRSYWLGVPKDKAKVGTLVIASRDGQSISVERAEGIEQMIVRLDDRMVDLDQDVILRLGEQISVHQLHRTIGTLIKTLLGRGDRQLMFSTELAFSITSG